MCAIIGIYQIAGLSSSNNDDKLAGNIVTLSSINRDGTSVVLMRDGKQTANERTMAVIDESVAKIVVEGGADAHVHVRFATTGARTVENAHFWKLGKWLFAHNGTVSAHSGGIGAGETDSLAFFRRLVKFGALGEGLDLAKTVALADIDGFYGRFVAIDTERGKAYYFGDFHWYNFGDKVAVFSQIRTFVGGLSSNALGIEFNSDIPHKHIAGLVVVDMVKRTTEVRELAQGWRSTDAFFSGVEGYEKAFDEIIEKDDTQKPVKKLVEATTGVATGGKYTWSEKRRVMEMTLSQMEASKMKKRYRKIMKSLTQSDWDRLWAEQDAEWEKEQLQEQKTLLEEKKYNFAPRGYAGDDKNKC